MEALGVWYFEADEVVQHVRTALGLPPANPTGGGLPPQLLQSGCAADLAQHCWADWALLPPPPRPAAGRGAPLLAPAGGGGSGVSTPLTVPLIGAGASSALETIGGVSGAPPPPPTPPRNATSSSSAAAAAGSGSALPRVRLLQLSGPGATPLLPTGAAFLEHDLQARESGSRPSQRGHPF